MLTVGDPAPNFTAPSTFDPALSFDAVTGRYVVLCFFGSAGHAPSRRVLDDIERNHERFDVLNACFCGVSVDAEDQRQGRIQQQWPGVIYFWDADMAVSRLYGVTAPGNAQYQLRTYILDPAKRIVGIVPFEQNTENHAAKVLELLGRLPPVTSLGAFAPVLLVPYVFEPALCQALITLHDSGGAQEIGVLREIDGKTVRVHDHEQKRRTDTTVADPQLLAEVRSRLERRVFPEIKKSFQFKPTRIERYIVSCYDATTGGHFRAHRDDSTRGSAHRRFAVTINLNADGYDGGDLRFPEYGWRTYRAPTGAAIVFSCTLMHEVRPVTRGKRYAFLPFIYDEEAARVREENERFLAADLRTV